MTNLAKIIEDIICKIAKIKTDKSMYFFLVITYACDAGHKEKQETEESCLLNYGFGDCY